jgi:proline iminopeptidase
VLKVERSRGIYRRLPSRDFSYSPSPILFSSFILKNLCTLYRFFYLWLAIFQQLLLYYSLDIIRRLHQMLPSHYWLDKGGNSNNINRRHRNGDRIDDVDEEDDGSDDSYKVSAASLRSYLPTHYHDQQQRRERNQHTNNSTFASPLLRPPPPSLCVTGAMSRVGQYVVKNSDKEMKSDHKDSSSINTTTITYKNNSNDIILSYVIFRPRQLHSVEKPPLICLHGGPSIPSNYLLCIVNEVTDRSILFYDQYGCGKSSRPSITITAVVDDDNNINNNKNHKSHCLPSFSIQQHVEHLYQLIHHEWKLSKFHLLGHSWGGILAFEYLKKMSTMEDQQQQQQQLYLQQNQEGDNCDANVTSTSPKLGYCCSLTLSNTPTSSKLIEEETIRLYQELMNQEEDTSNTSSIAASAPTDTARSMDQQKDEDSILLSPSQTSLANARSSIIFQQTHECRLEQIPLALMDSLAQVGPVEWRGLPAIMDYVAQGQIINTVNNTTAIPTLILRGEYDFCTVKCIEKWKEHLSTSSSSSTDGVVYYKTLVGCSHYAMLEDEQQYGQVVMEFLQKHDNDPY